jgi:hypothetical protein
LLAQPCIHPEREEEHGIATSGPASGSLPNDLSMTGKPFMQIKIYATVCLKERCSAN